MDDVAMDAAATLLVDGQWVITTSTLTRLREDVFNGLLSIRVSPRLRDAGARLVRRG
jgi:hypothetical protein